MVYHGRVKNGVVVLDGHVSLPEGTEVSVEVPGEQKGASTGGETPTLEERLASFIGRVNGLPPDASKNHDHYLYGLPKK